MEFYSENIINIKGIGPKKSELLNSIGISTVGELLRYFPMRYNFYKFYSEPAAVNCGGKCLFYITYDGTAKRKYSPKTGYYVSWQTKLGNKVFMFTWFNQPYVINTLINGKRYAVFADIEYNGRLCNAVNPHFLTNRDYKESFMEPLYRTPSGISSSQLSGFIKSVLDRAKGKLVDDIPEELRKKYNIPVIYDALSGVHVPQNEQDAIMGMRRFIFEEFFIFRMRQLVNKQRTPDISAAIEFDDKLISKFISSLPYELTSAQLCAANEIFNDMSAFEPMNRIVQGDVGSGKTVVAFMACLAAKSGGVQSMIMVPTEVLARQHMKSFCDLLSGFDIKAELLVGSISKKDKKSVKEAFSLGTTDVLIGTQAVLEDDVYSENVGLVITDEQHRFGVKQRLNLKNKGKPVNMLVLTATPIPRTLALVLYSDLAVSIIDEMPKGRIPVRTYLRRSDARENVYSFALSEIKSGRQVYVICPLIDSDDEGQASVKTLYDELSQNELKSVKCAMLYGGMHPNDKDRIMNTFAAGNIDVLISTTVVEVGVNVPNATVMIIENAERFGLAQLHQLRGRVGRGTEKSYCILMSDSDSETATARLDMLAKTNNGFEIAKEDLRLRGQGEYFGLRQHGVGNFTLGELPRDAELFVEAAEAAKLVSEEAKYAEYYKKTLKRAEELNRETVFN